MSRPVKAVKNGLIFGAVALVYASMNALPLQLARRLGRFLGGLFFLAVPYERKKALRQVGLAFPEKSDEERRAIAKGAFVHLGGGAAEFMQFPRSSQAALEERMLSSIQGWQHMQAAYDKGKGVVAVTAHVGHWEFLAACTAARLPVAVVARQAYDSRLDDRLNAIRMQKGITVFARNTSVKPILRWLKDGKVLGVLCDQDTGVDSLYVDFFGREAKTPSGAAWLAAVTGASILTAFSRRLQDGRYLLEYESELAAPPRGIKAKADLAPCVGAYTARTEAAIRRSPEQWAWMHERWRSKKSEASTGWDPAEA